MIKSDFKHWIGESLGTTHFQITALKGDASFRTYYRIQAADKTYIAMLAPPEKEKTDEFVAIARYWESQGLCVPQILAWQQQAGFVLLSDFGDVLLLDTLNEQTVDMSYSLAMQSLLPLQMARPTDYRLPSFGATHVRQELSLFDEWFLGTLLNVVPTENEQQLLENTYHQLIQVVTEQPQVVIHRDYHSRNIMVLPNHHLGIIDFQDAMIGPITYDLVSLLKDCYIAWPLTRVHHWAHDFYNMLHKQKRIKDVSAEQFIEWFDCVGLQRHLKVLGIFSRLKFRDNKASYLHDIPRIMDYVLAITEQYSFLTEFDSWLKQSVLPILMPTLTKYTLSSQSQVA
ncbi:phosphotransferase [Candidatus Berkiella aquae]|uniref:Phosphotransferase n=1 Tax=Candidatus Berkiella aquae TaxID=295108 RepID=A0A0Q9YWC5_9GAMM|nr:phosphotransferase [Candidatus Berkiella aquae]MCS5710115.1 phosphotransferase [Candidatus Berkiella aquae]